MNTDPGQPHAIIDWTKPDLAEHLAMYNLSADFNQGVMFPIGATNLTRVVTGSCWKDDDNPLQRNCYR